MVRLRPALVVHYHEISLKRGNRPLFLRHLRRNVERALADTGPPRSSSSRGASWWISRAIRHRRGRAIASRGSSA